MIEHIGAIEPYVKYKDTYTDVVYYVHITQVRKFDSLESHRGRTQYSDYVIEDNNLVKSRHGSMEAVIDTYIEHGR